VGIESYKSNFTPPQWDSIRNKADCADLHESWRGFRVILYVCSLTTWFIKISEFLVSLGSIDVDGNEDYAITYEPIKIPLGKVYYYGEWVDPKIVKEEEMRNRISACNS